MIGFSLPDWQLLFVPSRPLIETVIRGTVMYLGILLLLRLVLKRQSTSLNTADLLVVVVLADAAQNGLAGDYHSITEGLALITTILFWDYAIDWLCFRSPKFRHWFFPPALLLVKDGVLQRHNMRRELVSIDELRTRMHEEGIADLRKVKKAWIEGDGALTFLQE